MKTQRNLLRFETHRNFLEAKLRRIFQDQKNFLEQKNFSEQKNFLEPYAVNVVKNFKAGVGSLGKKVKEVEEDARRRFCDYPSA